MCMYACVICVIYIYICLYTFVNVLLLRLQPATAQTKPLRQPQEAFSQCCPAQGFQPVLARMVLDLVAQVTASLGDLPSTKLDELALAVAAEQSRRVGEVPPTPPPAAAEPVLPEPVGEPAPGPPQPEILTTLRPGSGRVWHRDRRCQHVRCRQVITHAEPPPGFRLCRICVGLDPLRASP